MEKSKRFTKKINSTYCEYELKESPYKDLFDLKSNQEIEDNVDCELTLAIDKLGKLEDLEEKEKDVRKNLANAIRDYAKHYYPNIDFKKLKIEGERVANKVTSLTCDAQSSLTLIGVLICMPEEGKE